MAMEGPINYCAVTKEVAPPPSAHPPPPPGRTPPTPPLWENRRCLDCIIASITVIIYTSILSLPPLVARRRNQSRRAAAGSAGSYFRSDKFFFGHARIFGEGSDVRRRGHETSSMEATLIFCSGSVRTAPLQPPKVDSHLHTSAPTLSN